MHGQAAIATPAARTCAGGVRDPAQALANELLNYLDPDAWLFKVCRASLFEAGEPLLKRAEEAGVVCSDVAEVLQMVMGIAKVPRGDPAQKQHMLRIARDGLRYRPASSSRGRQGSRYVPRVHSCVERGVRPLTVGKRRSPVSLFVPHLESGEAL